MNRPDNDEDFLRALAEHVVDEDDYAEWLEERGDPRAPFLRIQQAFAYGLATGHLELYEREQQFVRQLDPTWLQRVRSYTTAPPCRDLGALIPELQQYARTTTRLHPHRAAGPLPEWMSKIGGRFLWPTSEPWPSCAMCNVDLAPVLQLFRRDVPDLAFPFGTDLLQLFWCPDEAAHDYEPAPYVTWRTSASVVSLRTDDPDLSRFPRNSEWEGYVPFECAVYPELIIEYPVGDDLDILAGPEQASRIGRLIELMDVGSIDDLAERYRSEYGPSLPQSLAFYELGQCPGTKVGGKPGLVQKGRHFDHLVTFATWEFDSASFRRWLSVEDQRLLAPPGQPLTWQRLFRESNFQHLQEVMGMQLGRTQRAHVYVCRDREPGEVIAQIGD